MPTPLSGVYAPVLTPFNRDLQPDAARFVAHCQWLVQQGAGLAIFGTNSEAASLSTGERMALTDQLLAAGVPAARLMPGTGACALTDAVALTRHAVSHGAPGVLVLPPFFFKQPSDDGLFAYYSEIIERVGSEQLAIYLYHIPQLSGAPITLGLIERLLARYPKTVLGAKDSSGDWANAKAMIDQFGGSGFAVFPASESLLAQALAIGGAGCISATVNMNPAGIRALFDGWHSGQGEALQGRANVIRQIFQALPMIPAMKRVLAECTGDAAWRTVRPPLCAMDDAGAAALMSVLRDAGFSMPGHPARAVA